MAYHGQTLDSGYDPVRDNIYPLFSQYFENPRMIKIKDIGKYSMYMIKIHAILGIEFRYLIVFISKNDLPKGDEKFLNQLEWTSLQTRTLTDDHNLPFHSYIPRRIPNLDQKIQLKTKDEHQYIYSVTELPVQITLLPTSKGLDYNSSGSVVTALETYQTLVTIA